MQFDRAESHKERLRDLLVACALGGQLGDTPLAGGQSVGTDASAPSGSAAGGAQLFEGPVGERCGPTPVCEVQAIPQDRSRADDLSIAPQRSAQVDVCFRAPEQGGRGGQCVCCLAEQVQTPLTTLDQATDPQCSTYSGAETQRLSRWP